ncbi:MAG: hypothetical protein AB7R89_21525 [Dehalococcoidia bacterium]
MMEASSVADLEGRLSAAHANLGTFLADHPLVWPDIWFHLETEKRSWTQREDEPLEDLQAEEVLAEWRQCLRSALWRARRAAPVDEETRTLIVQCPDLAQRHAGGGLFQIAEAGDAALTTLKTTLTKERNEHVRRAMECLEPQIEQFARDRVAARVVESQPVWSGRSDQLESLIEVYTRMAETIVRSAVGPGGWTLVRLDTFKPAHNGRVLHYLAHLCDHLRAHVPADPFGSIDAFWEHYHPSIVSVVRFLMADRMGEHQEDIIQRMYVVLTSRGYERALRWKPGTKSSKSFLEKLIVAEVANYMREREEQRRRRVRKQQPGKPREEMAADPTAETDRRYKILSLDRMAQEIADLCNGDENAWADSWLSIHRGRGDGRVYLDSAAVKRCLSEILPDMMIRGTLSMQRLLILCGKLQRMSSLEIAILLDRTENLVDVQYSELMNALLGRLARCAGPA